MRACWLKWVGRDWSISADYIWLNYSGANMGKSNEKDATTASNGNDAITDSSLSSDAPFCLG
jgi:hypothetical protein